MVRDDLRCPIGSFILAGPLLFFALLVLLDEALEVAHRGPLFAVLGLVEGLGLRISRSGSLLESRSSALVRRAHLAVARPTLVPEEAIA